MTTKNYLMKILINTGDMYFRNQVYGNDKDENKYYPFLEIHTKVMDDKIYKSMEIMADIVKNSLFEDNKRIREIIRELISRIEMMLMQSRTSSCSWKSCIIFFTSSIIYGKNIRVYDYYRFLKDIENDFDNKIENLKSKLYKLKSTIFNKNNLIVFVTGEDKELNLLKENMNKVVDILSTESLNNNEYKFNEEQKK